MLGQVSYHLLAAGHATRAPDVVVVLVSCLPVAVLGCAVALLHLLSAALPAADAVPGAHLGTTPEARLSAPGVHRPMGMPPNASSWPSFAHCVAMTGTLRQALSLPAA
jgi:hypothetical protein